MKNIRSWIFIMLVVSASIIGFIEYSKQNIEPPEPAEVETGTDQEPYDTNISPETDDDQTPEVKDTSPKKPFVEEPTITITPEMYSEYGIELDTDLSLNTWKTFRQKISASHCGSSRSSL